MQAYIQKLAKVDTGRNSKMGTAKEDKLNKSTTDIKAQDKLTN